VVAERDGYSFPNAVPNDPRFGELWGLQNTGAGISGVSGAIAGDDIGAVAAWSRTIGSESVVIADLDTGYRFDSPDLGPVAWANAGEIAANGIDDDANGFVDDTRGYDFVGPSASSPSSDNDPTDDNLISGGHGVHTAGTMGAAGNNGVGITGVAQNVRIMPLRVCANNPSTNEASCPVSSQIAAINYAGDNGARAANMSLGGTSTSQAEVNAFAANPQTLFVISAGNDAANNESIHHYPCDYTPQSQSSPPVGGAIDNIVCVAATTQADSLAGFSDWGAQSVDLGAPGTEILGTYPAQNTEFEETFQANDFATKWTNAGSGFGRAAAGDGPLTSFGMNDSPGGAPVANSAHQTTTTTGVNVPAGSGSCTLSGLRFRNPDPGSGFSYSVLSDNVAVFTNSTSTATAGSAMVSFNTVPITGLGGHSVKFSFSYTAGSAPVAANGIWFDNLKLACNAPLATPPGYAFLQGTSMAAPHVTGAAGLLFSLKPAATVTQVRNALLAGVDAVPSLAGKTVSGGRLDLPKAMDALEGLPTDSAPPAAPVLTSTNPSSPANNAAPTIIGSAEAGSTVRIYLGAGCSGVPQAEGSAALLASPGIAVSVPAATTREFAATATDGAHNTSSCSAPISYTNPGVVIGPGEVKSDPLQESLPTGGAPAATPAQLVIPTCKVPKLSGKSLAQAKAALKAASCRLGKVTKPKGKSGTLVVKSSSPAAGSRTSTRVALKLGPKPKKRSH
jgi:subtilisin family serine protease